MTYGSGSPDVHVTGRRVVATIVDSIVFGIFNSIYHAVFGVQKDASGFDLTRLSAKGSGWLLLTVLLYYVLLEGLVGRTLGKMVTGIRVVDAETGGQPGILSAVVRTLLRLVDGILAYLVGFIIVVNSQRRRRLGDMAAKTLVVRSR
jgi:uncharacterized RDD family membrane protein YckC